MNGLSVDGIDAFYGRSHVLHNVSLHIPTGSVATILGRNGAGKTTTIRSICGLLQPKNGSISLNGQRISDLRADQITRLGVSCVSEGRDIFTHISVRENLAIAARRGSPWTLERILDDFSLIKPLLPRPGGALSGGEQQIVAIARALMLGPQILLLDEPSQGLAPVMVDRVLEVLSELKGTNLTMLVVEQKLDIALELAEFVYILDNGRVVHSSRTADLSDDMDLIHRHLGVGL